MVADSAPLLFGGDKYKIAVAATLLRGDNVRFTPQKRTSMSAIVGTD